MSNGASEQSLQEENRQVLNLVQAMLGAVSPNFRAVSIDCRNDIVLRFVLLVEDAGDREEIGDIEFEFLALQSNMISVDTEILVSAEPMENISLPGRRVFLRREE